jgi:hypothetical protein
MIQMTGRSRRVADAKKDVTLLFTTGHIDEEVPSRDRAADALVEVAGVQPGLPAQAEQAIDEPPPSEIEAYAHLSRDELTSLILYLLVQEALADKFALMPDAVKAHVIRRHHVGERA